MLVYIITYITWGNVDATIENLVRKMCCRREEGSAVGEKISVYTIRSKGLSAPKRMNG